MKHALAVANRFRILSAPIVWYADPDIRWASTNDMSENVLKLPLLNA
jgi:hypothetical protein